METAAKNEFVMNCSVFGKTIENIRNHHDMKLVTSQEKYPKLVAKHNWKGSIWFSKNLMGVEIVKTEIKTVKSVYLGQAFL